MGLQLPMPIIGSGGGGGRSQAAGTDAASATNAAESGDTIWVSSVATAQRIQEQVDSVQEDIYLTHSSGRHRLLRDVRVRSLMAAVTAVA